MKKITGLVWFVGVIGPLLGQPISTAILQDQKAALEQQYALTHGSLANWLNGREYNFTFPFSYGHPFWETNEWTIGNLSTTFHTYPSVLIKYDAYFDALVFAADLVRGNIIWVNPDQVISFVLRGKTFVYYGRGTEKEQLKAVKLFPGYFELLYDGPTRLLVKRAKYLKPIQNDLDKTDEFGENSRRYLIRDHVFHLIRGKGDFLRFAAAHKEEMSQYIKERNLRFRIISDAQFVALVAYYDSL
ncbi:MAG: hypothetical protein AAF587_13785 [Bacteroidota bacterium]